MPARDFFHDACRVALERDGWVITHDPFTLTYGARSVFVDLAAEGTLGAEKAGRKIAVEIKSFLEKSSLRDFELALGQYVFYRSLLSRVEPSRNLYLAVPNDAYEATFTEPIARPSLEDLGVLVMCFEPKQGRVVRWSP